MTGAFSRIFNEEDPRHRNARLDEFRRANPGVELWPDWANNTYYDPTVFTPPDLPPLSTPLRSRMVNVLDEVSFTFGAAASFSAAAVFTEPLVIPLAGISL